MHQSLILLMSSLDWRQIPYRTTYNLSSQLKTITSIRSKYLMITHSPQALNLNQKVSVILLLPLTQRGKLSSLKWQWWWRVSNHYSRKKRVVMSLKVKRKVLILRMPFYRESKLSPKNMEHLKLINQKQKNRANQKRSSLNLGKKWWNQRKSKWP